MLIFNRFGVQASNGHDDHFGHQDVLDERHHSCDAHDVVSNQGFQIRFLTKNGAAGDQPCQRHALEHFAHSVCVQDASFLQAMWSTDLGSLMMFKAKFPVVSSNFTVFITKLGDFLTFPGEVLKWCL